MAAALTVLLLADLLYSNSFIWDPRDITWSTSKQCKDSKGAHGTCMSLSACYLNSNDSESSGLSTFLSGDYDSCAFLKRNGKPFIGACCPNKSSEEFQVTPQLSSTSINNVSSTAFNDPISILIPIPKPQSSTSLPAHSLPTRPTISAYQPFSLFTWFTTTRTPPTTAATTFRPWWIPINEKQKIFTSTQKPAPPVNIPTDCGRRNNSFRVVGGQKAGYWPWVAGLMGNKGLFCGGSLVTNYHILTAAHCVTGLSPNDITVRLGDLDLSDATEKKHIDVKVSSIIIHPDYNSKTNQHDVAIIRLKSKINFNSEISPICLPKDNMRNYTDNIAIVIGWGATRVRGPSSKILMQLSMRVWSYSECQNKFQTSFPNYIYPTNICAGDGGKDACSGDSGGPLMNHDNGKYTQIGIVSWGIACGMFNYPGVYSRVTSFIDWIKNNLN